MSTDAKMVVSPFSSLDALSIIVFVIFTTLVIFRVLIMTVMSNCFTSRAPLGHAIDIPAVNVDHVSRGLQSCRRQASRKGCQKRTSPDPDNTEEMIRSRNNIKRVSTPEVFDASEPNMPSSISRSYTTEIDNMPFIVNIRPENWRRDACSDSNLDSWSRFDKSKDANSSLVSSKSSSRAHQSSNLDDNEFSLCPIDSKDEARGESLEKMPEKVTDMGETGSDICEEVSMGFGYIISSSKDNANVEDRSWHDLVTLDKQNCSPKTTPRARRNKIEEGSYAVYNSHMSSKHSFLKVTAGILVNNYQNKKESELSRLKLQIAEFCQKTLSPRLKTEIEEKSAHLSESLSAKLSKNSNDHRNIRNCSTMPSSVKGSRTRLTESQSPCLSAMGSDPCLCSSESFELSSQDKTLGAVSDFELDAADADIASLSAISSKNEDISEKTEHLDDAPLKLRVSLKHCVGEVVESIMSGQGKEVMGRTPGEDINREEDTPNVEKTESSGDKKQPLGTNQEKRERGKERGFSKWKKCRPKQKSADGFIKSAILRKGGSKMSQTSAPTGALGKAALAVIEQTDHRAYSKTAMGMNVWEKMGPKKSPEPKFHHVETQAATQSEEQRITGDIAGRLISTSKSPAKPQPTPKYPRG